MTFQDAPYFDDTPEGEAVAKAYWLNSKDGVRLRLAVWPNEGPAKGTVLFFPGRTEYVEKYALTAGELAAHGFTTASIDWRGQGLADRLQPNIMAGHVQEFSDYQLDVAAMINAVKALDLPQPYYLIGHSMGGCIGLRALYEGLDVKACAFTGPMWDIGLGPFLRPFASVVSTVLLTIGLGNWLAPGTSNETYMLDTAFEDNQLTKDRQMYARLVAQARAHPELSIGGPSIRWLNKALRECTALSKQTPLTVPCLTFLGTDEKIVSPDAITSRMTQWDNGELVMVEHGEHEVLMEGHDVRDPITNKIAALFLAHP